MDTTLTPPPDQKQHAEKLHEEIAVLRQKLKQLKVWPEAGDEFLTLVPPSRRHATPPTQKENEWLPLVVKKVVEGHDIGANFPDFFQRLLVNSSLRQAFLEALDQEINGSR